MRRRCLLRLAIMLGASAAFLPSANPFLIAQSAPPGKHSAAFPRLPITKFYDTPDPLPPGKPGELIRSQPFEQYELPISVSAVRILYHSRSSRGEDVAASGFVLLPSEKKPPAGGWPVIAWAHGAAGVARPCAPSLMKNVGHGPFLSMYVNLGYAVVAADYTGLGTNFRNAFLDGSSNAADVMNAVSAARAAVPQLGARWIAMGEAEGGLTALAIAEKESEIRDPNFRGTLAISEILTVRELYDLSSPAPSSLMLASLAYGVKTVYPQFQLNAMLTESAASAYQHLDEMCSARKSLPDLPAADVVKPAWKNDPLVRQYFDRNNLGETPSFGPIFVISGSADQSMPAAMTANAIARMCKHGDQVQWERYPGLDPSALLGYSVRNQIEWLEARFAGRAAANTCH